MDQRKIGGTRVAAAFRMDVANQDPFKPFADKFYGTLVVNARGGYLHLTNHNAKQAESRIFADGPVATLSKLEIDVPEEPCCLLKNIKIKVIGTKGTKEQNGIVFKFVQLTDIQLDQLNSLKDKLPPAANDWEY